MTYNYLTLERTRNHRRARRWRRRLGAARWIALLVLLVLGAVHACSAAAADQTAGRDAVSDWPWWTIPALVTLLMCVFALILWVGMMGLDGTQVEPAAMPEGPGDTVPAGPCWMRELRAFFRHRWVLVTDEQCHEMAALCAPDHPAAIAMLDDYLRRRMGLTLFVSTLLTVQEICLKKPMATEEQA